MMSQQDAILFGEPEHAHRQAPDGAGDTIAIKVEGGEIRRTDILRDVHLHAVDDREEILTLQAEAANGCEVILQPRRRMALIERVDVVAPLLDRRQPFRPRPGGISDIVNLPAEIVDLEHRVALLARQDPHRCVEGAAGRGRPIIRVRRRRLKRHAPAARLDVGRRPTVRCMTSPAIPPAVRASNSSGDRCTRSLRGSRSLSSLTIRSAKLWITEISSPSRKSFTSALNDLLSLNSASVRTARPCRHCRNDTEARSFPSSSTEAPAAASASSGT